MDWFNASLPFWILGAPLVCAIVDWIGTPKVHGSARDMGRGRTSAPA